MRDCKRAFAGTGTSNSIEDILNRQRDLAKQKQQEQKDVETRASDQKSLVELWDNVRYYDGNDAHEWISLVTALALSLDDRGLMGRLKEPPTELRGWHEYEPDAFHLAAEIYRQALIDNRKAVRLLLEAWKLQQTTWPRVREWIRRELRDHVEGRWAAIHAPQRKPFPEASTSPVELTATPENAPANRPNRLIIQRNNWIVRENGSGQQISVRLRDHIAAGNRIDPKPDYAYWKPVSKNQVNEIKKTWTIQEEPPTD